MVHGARDIPVLLTATVIVAWANTTRNFTLAQKIIAAEKISLNVSRCRNRPACMAGVLTSHHLVLFIFCVEPPG